MLLGDGDSIGDSFVADAAQGLACINGSMRNVVNIHGVARRLRAVSHTLARPALCYTSCSDDLTRRYGQGAKYGAYN